jgi:uncharacterized protein YchJ
MARGNPEPWFRECRNTWYVTINGRQHNLQTADKDEAHRRWHKLMVQSEQVPLSPQATVIEILALFADHSEKHHKPASYEWYRNFLQSFLDHIPTSLRVDELKPFHVTTWLDANTQWGVSGRRGAICALKRAFQWAVDEGYLSHSPIRKIRKPQPKPRATVLTAEQRQTVLAEARDQAFRDFIALIQETGARPQEIRIVEARHFEETKGLWVFSASEHKTGARGTAACGLPHPHGLGNYTSTCKGVSRRAALPQLPWKTVDAQCHSLSLTALATPTERPIPWRTLRLPLSPYLCH